MERDSITTSLWQNQMPEYQPENKHTPDGEIFDVIIVGGGITGVTTALLLQKHGKKCLLAEAHTIGFGTTSGTTAHLNTMLDNPYDVIARDFGNENARLVATVTRDAIDLVKSHVDEYAIDCDFAELPGYVFSQDNKQSDDLADILEGAQKAGAQAGYCQSIPVPLPFEKALRFERQAQFHPVKYLYALARAFEASGGVIRQHCTITEVASQDDVLDVTGSQGNFKARQLVYATHIPPGVNVMHFRNAPYRSYVLAATLKNSAYPDGLAYDMHDPYHYYRTQETDGQKYLIAGGEDHKTAHGENTEAYFRNLESHVRRHFDVENVAFRWSSQYFEPADGLAYIGHLPGSPGNVFVATGFGGNGMTYSHVAALVLCELLTTGDSPYKNLFAPGRVKPIAGFVNFVKESADVVGEFVGKWFSQSKIESLSELAHGEAKVVSYEGQSMALYKDEQGRLHAVSPTCPHAKCAVGWNSAEKSWDCPCHGSRFSPDGKLLTGPARTDLERIDLRELEEK